jgi:amino-acid N-acetyltransferase
VSTDPGAAPVRVREAAPADLPAVHELVRAAGLPLEGLDDAAHVLVAVADGVVVGTVALERHDDASGPVFLLRSAAVGTSCRSRGIGAVLVTAALAVVDTASAEVALLTETAADYFPRFGFRPVPRDALPAALAASAELGGACPVSAAALLRPAPGRIP